MAEVETTKKLSVGDQLGNAVVEQRNNYNDYTCRMLVKRMEHFVKNPPTKPRTISNFLPMSYGTSCQEFRSFMSTINNSEPMAKVIVENFILDKKMKIETDKPKVSHLNPIVTYDSLIYKLE